MNDAHEVSWFDRTGAFTLPACAALSAVGLRKRPDPWRRTLGVGLRSEGSKFVLLPPKDDAERAVDLVSIRPADFGDRFTDSRRESVPRSDV